MLSSHFESTLGLACASIVLVAFYLIRRFKASLSPTLPNVERSQSGAWTPHEFAYPAFEACPVDLSDIDPVPYRPFRWGQYHVTMGIRSMPWDSWIEIDSQFLRYYRIRERRIKTRGQDVVRMLPDNPPLVKSAYQGAIELVHELSEFLHKRYPSVYWVTRDSEFNIERITILPLAATFILPPPLRQDAKASTKLRAVEHCEGESAMKMAAMLTQDDIALMVEGTDGLYYFQGGAICIPGSWRLTDKIGLSLEAIHDTGGVPQYREKLHVGMTRFFRRLAVDKPVIRNNYSIQVVPASNRDSIDPEELAWSTTLNGPETAFDDNRAHPPETPVVKPENLRLRSERQTLRRLPLSGVVVFGIRTYVFNLQELASEPGVAARLASAVRSWPEDVQEYKGKRLYADVLLEYLDKRADEQCAEVETVKSEYPF
ncbi:hypothetical protein BDZ89DRAFT_1066153 [Hymenopellis radicata]|nr:hypothetical protein BDZ89DRAFT_1066153 [Hymenopellis radicata]